MLDSNRRNNRRRASLWPSKVIVPDEEHFVDARGAIIPLVDLPMKSAVLIQSNKGAVRANHYHKTDIFLLRSFWVY